MNYTAAQKHLLEADFETRKLIRSTGVENKPLNPPELVKIANHYRRTGDPRLQELVFPLRDAGYPEANEIANYAVDIFNLPTADEMTERLRNVGSFEAAIDAIRDAGFRFINNEETGRSGSWYQAELFQSPADMGYVWVVYGNEEGEESWNYGPWSEEDFRSARSEWEDDYNMDWDYGGGLLEYLRDYL